MQIQIQILKKPTDLDVHCKDRTYPGSAGPELTFIFVENPVKNFILDEENLCKNLYIETRRPGKIVSSPEQRSRRAIVLPPALASTNVEVFVKVFKTSLFPSLITDLLHLWYDDTYWSKILHSTIPTTLGHVKVKVTDLEFSC